MQTTQICSCSFNTAVTIKKLQKMRYAFLVIGRIRFPPKELRSWSGQYHGRGHLRAYRSYNQRKNKLHSRCQLYVIESLRRSNSTVPTDWYSEASQPQKSTDHNQDHPSNPALCVSGLRKQLHLKQDPPLGLREHVP